MNHLRKTQTGTVIRRREAVAHSRLAETIHPVLKRIYAARNIQTDDELDYSLATLLPFATLTGIEAAVALLHHNIEHKKRILIVADFDADGATSCALAIRALTMMGCEDIVYVVPNRFEYGYGLSPAIVDVALDYDPALLITVDNGISSIAGVHHAKQNGLQVLITDHHLPGAALPDADVIVNPQLKGDLFPSKNLAGVGVVFYILLALRAHLKAAAWFDKQGIAYPNLAKLLDLVALGTIADVVPLDRNNRVMVAHGLKLIQQQRAVAGIAAILKQVNKNQQTLTATDIAFSIAPQLNAAGRLTDMSLGIECLLTDDVAAAKTMAMELHTLNKERRKIQSEMQQQADHELATYLNQAEDIPLGICLFNPDWHQGVIGILAGRLKETFNRPVIIFAKEDPDSDIIKGSCRSIAALHIRDLLEEITRLYPNLILSFGGHAMAAGLTIHQTEFATFSKCFVEVLGQHISTAIQDESWTDGELTGDDYSLTFATLLQAGGPWGQGFPEPLFDGIFKIMDRRVVADKHLKLKLQNEDHQVIHAIAFNTSDEDWSLATERVFATYRLAINDYLGQQQLQLLIDYIEPL